jgi:hypothetical protein
MGCGRTLPAHAPALGNRLQTVVTPRRVDLGGAARHRARAWRHNDFRIGVPRRHLGEDVITVERAVGGE